MKERKTKNERKKKERQTDRQKERKKERKPERKPERKKKRQRKSATKKNKTSSSYRHSSRFRIFRNFRPPASPALLIIQLTSIYLSKCMFAKANVCHRAASCHAYTHATTSDRCPPVQIVRKSWGAPRQTAAGRERGGEGERGRGGEGSFLSPARLEAIAIGRETC